MREYSTPLPRDPHDRQPDRRRRRQRAGCTEAVAFSRRAATGGPTSPRRSSSPRSPDLADPLRVDPARLRDLVRRRGHRADLRDLLRRAGRLDPRGLRRRAVVAEPPPRRPGRGGPPSGLPAGRATSGRSTTARSTTCRARGDVGPTTSSTSARGRSTRLDLATLIYTSGTTGAAQGLHAHPRQLHRRVGNGGRGRSTTSSTRTPRRCCSCRWRTCSRGSSRSAA